MWVKFQGCYITAYIVLKHSNMCFVWLKFKKFYESCIDDTTIKWVKPYRWCKNDWIQDFLVPS